MKLSANKVLYQPSLNLMDHLAQGYWDTWFDTLHQCDIVIYEAPPSIDNTHLFTQTWRFLTITGVTSSPYLPLNLAIKEH